MKAMPATSVPLPVLTSVLILGATSCIIPRFPGQSDNSYEASRARVACVDEAKRVGFDHVRVVSDREGGREATGFGSTILIDLRVDRGGAPDSTAEIDRVTCSYDVGTRRASVLT